jgi:hypothetical protein
MKQYLISMYQPDGNPPPPEVLGPIMNQVGAWREDLQAVLLADQDRSRWDPASSRRDRRSCAAACGGTSRVRIRSRR